MLLIIGKVGDGRRTCDWWKCGWDGGGRRGTIFAVQGHFSVNLEHLKPPPEPTAGQVAAGSVLAARNSVCAALLAATPKDIIAGGGCQCEALAR